jgi:hypothetical protein
LTSDRPAAYTPGSPPVQVAADSASAEDPGAWHDLEIWDRLSSWERRSPGTAAELIGILKAERRHVYRMDWAIWVKQMLGVTLGFGCVVVMALLAWHYADLNAPVSGAVVMGAGTASIVAIFVTGKYVGRGTQRPNARRP